MANKWQDLPGTTPVAVDGQRVGRWRDMLGSRDLVAPTASQRFWWNDVDKYVEAIYEPLVGSSTYQLLFDLVSPIQITDPMTVMVTVDSTVLANNGSSRIGLINSISGTNGYTQPYPSNVFVGGINVSGTGTCLRDSGPGLGYGTTKTRISFVKLPTGQFSELHVNGVRTPNDPPAPVRLDYGGPSELPVGNVLNRIQISFNTASNAPAPKLRVKDFIVAFKEATKADHLGYADYAQNL